MATALKTETLIVIGVALAALVMGKLAVDKAGQAVDGLKAGLGNAWDTAVDTVQEVVPYVNPADERNVINQGATSAYQAATGSTGTIGGDLYDATHGGVLTNVSWWQLANPATAVGTVAADAMTQSSVGQSIKGWWDSL